MKLLDVDRDQSCAARGTHSSGTTGPDGTWRMQLDTSSPPRPCASWSPLLTLSRWKLLTSECESHFNSESPFLWQGNLTAPLWGSGIDVYRCNIVMVVVVIFICLMFMMCAAWQASKRASSRRWQTAREFCWNALTSWRRKAAPAQVQDTTRFFRPVTRVRQLALLCWRAVKSTVKMDFFLK